MSGSKGLPRLTVTVRPLAAHDATAFLRFVSQVPDGERRFLKEELDNPAEAFGGFLRDASARRLVAVEEDGDIAGLAGAFPGEGWSSHVAEVRVLVSAARRGHGLGRVMARAALMEALNLGCSQVYVEVVAEQEALVEMFQDLGFAPEALLSDFVRDGDGEYHDLMLLTHRAIDHWGRQQLLGLDMVNA